MPQSSIDILKQVPFVPSLETEKLFHQHCIHFGLEGISGSFNGCVAKQVHGTNIVEARSAATWDTSIEADGIWSETPGLRIAAKTADCLPVLLTTADKTMVMALHAGWRGLCAGIIGHGINLMNQRRPGQPILALLGPAIHGSHYEVGADVVEAATAQAAGLTPEQHGWCLLRGPNDRWYFDLATAAVLQLHNFGVSPNNISVISSCTKSHPQLWHSFRRDKTRFGSNYTWIAI
jgi:YfiH family protein